MPLLGPGPCWPTQGKVRVRLEPRRDLIHSHTMLPHISRHAINHMRPSPAISITAWSIVVDVRSAQLAPSPLYDVQTFSIDYVSGCLCSPFASASGRRRAPSSPRNCTVLLGHCASSCLRGPRRSLRLVPNMPLKDSLPTPSPNALVISHHF
jgi:hypothetical protein